jgi:type IV pilus assembly protein PilW
MKHPHITKKQYGIGLVEVMIAMSIGAFLIGGLIQMFITTQKTNRLQDAVSRVQENGHYAMEFISQDMRMADYFLECGTSLPDTTAIMGTDNTTGDPDIVDGTDTITIRQTVGSCDTRVTNTIVYSIRLGANNQPSLFKQVNGAVAQELIEGIENMQILYGVDTDVEAIDSADDEMRGTPNYYVPATNVVTELTGWEDVVSVQVNLLATTLDNNVSSVPLPYYYNGEEVLPADDDKRIRKVYSSTITLRNRLQ